MHEIKVVATGALFLLATGCAGRGASTRPGTVGSGEEAPVRPYAEVITEEAITDSGLFTVHRVGEKLYYEIPASELAREMLLVSKIEENTRGQWGNRPIDNRVLVWERRGGQILVRSPSYEVTADSALPIYQAVQAARYAPVVAALDIAAWGPDSAAVVEVSELFVGDTPEFGAGAGIQNARLDDGRSFVERVASYPTNVEVAASHTYALRGEHGFPGRSLSRVLRWSMVRLPERPMMPRLADSRVGYFHVEKRDFGADPQRAADRAYINRWRLECPEGEETPCVPVKAITFYVDPATPEWLKPYIAQGVEDWQESFEEAGFRNAIVAADPADVPDWSAADARYSTVMWLPSAARNARGPHVHDPRTGEVLESDIEMYHNIMVLLRNWYYAQVSPLDPRARSLPFPDTLMGPLVQYVVSHEVGHTLGLRHNMVGSANYPADSVRSVTWLRRMGHTPSIMDYARFNYVAQPEDSIPIDLLIPQIGPYDRFAIRWGYRPVPGAGSPDAERETLEEWVRVQDERPWLRFSTADADGSDAGSHNEAVGDADPVRSTELGLRNLRRAAARLVDVAVRPGEDFSDLNELYGAVVGQWSREIAHTMILIGGMESREIHGGQEGVRFTPVAADRQREAVAFLVENAFRTPDYLLDPEILRRISARGALQRIGDAQDGLFADWSGLFAGARLYRMIETEALAAEGEDVYTVPDYFRDLRRGAFEEVERGGVPVKPFRRNLHYRFLDAASRVIHPQPLPAHFPAWVADVIPPPPGEVRAVMRGELRDLDAVLARALPRSPDRTTRVHIQGLRDRIAAILDPAHSAP